MYVDVFFMFEGQEGQLFCLMKLGESLCCEELWCRFFLFILGGYVEFGYYVGLEMWYMMVVQYLVCCFFGVECDGYYGYWRNINGVVLCFIEVFVVDVYDLEDMVVQMYWMFYY